MRASIFALAIALSGCISVQPPDGVYSCLTDSDCPSGYTCDVASSSCWQRGHQPLVTVDMAAPDMTGGGPDSPECHDGVKDGDETDVDCGGSCASCATGQFCASGADCVSSICSSFSNKCVGT